LIFFIFPNLIFPLARAGAPGAAPEAEAEPTLYSLEAQGSLKGADHNSPRRRDTWNLSEKIDGTVTLVKFRSWLNLGICRKVKQLQEISKVKFFRDFGKLSCHVKCNKS
jgi:hypothetical protein